MIATTGRIGSRKNYCSSSFPISNYCDGHVHYDNFYGINEILILEFMSSFPSFYTLLF